MRGAAERLADQRGGGTVHHDRHAEVAVQHGVSQRQYCTGSGSLRPSLASELRDRGRRRELAQDRVGDIARQDMDDGEDQHRHAQKHADRPRRRRSRKAARRMAQPSVAVRRSNHFIGCVFTPATDLR